MIRIKDKIILDDGTIIEANNCYPIIGIPQKDGEVDEHESIKETATTTKPNNKPKHK